MGLLPGCDRNHHCCGSSQGVADDESFARFPCAELSGCRTPGELERVAALSNFQSRPAACTVGTGRFLRRKISFSRAKIVSLQAPRPKNLRFLAETGEGGRGGGACFPVHQLVKTFFDKLCGGNHWFPPRRLSPPGELERVAPLSNIQSRPAACTVGTGRFLRRKISFSREKIVSLQFLLPEIS